MIDPQTVNLKSNLSCRYTCITLDRHSTSMIYNACTYSYVSVKLCKSMYKVVHVWQIYEPESHPWTWM